MQTPPPSPPQARAGTSYTGEEGADVQFDGSASSDADGEALSFLWSFGDGTSATGVRPTHRYRDNGTYTVVLTVTNSSGRSSRPDTTTATIANVAPAVSLALAASEVVLGDAVALSGAFSDPGVLDSPWSYAVDWGDGTQQTGSASTQDEAILPTHSYSAAGSYTIRFSVTDKDGGEGTATRTLTVTPPPAAVLIGAGDIAGCGKDAHGIEYQDEATAALLDLFPEATVFTAGDNAYPNGTAEEFANCYGPTWGRHRARTRPSAGNHEYRTAGATPYFEYFGANAGEPGKGYYSYRAGSWHVVVLNSNLDMAAGSPQEQWLRADLAANPTRCTLAYWHHPRFSSSNTGLHNISLKPFWDALYDAGAELVLASHDHVYERFAPMRPDGTLDTARAIRQITVGTGGARLHEFYTINGNSQARNNRDHGILKLTLEEDAYSWEFIPVAGNSFTDSGRTACH